MPGPLFMTFTGVDDADLDRHHGVAHRRIPVRRMGGTRPAPNAWATLGTALPFPALAARHVCTRSGEALTVGA